MTAPRFELTSQRQKVSRLPTEPPGRPVLLIQYAQNVLAYFVLVYFFVHFVLELQVYIIGLESIKFTIQAGLKT